MVKISKFFIVVLLFIVALSSQVGAQSSTVDIVVEKTQTDTYSAALTIKANVSGASVYVNNVYKGTAPLTLEKMVPGTYGVDVVKDNYKEESVAVTIVATTKTTLYFELEEIVGFLRVKSNVNDGSLYLNDSLVSDTPSGDTGVLEVLQGGYKVEVKKFGWKSEVKKITVNENQLTEVTINLEKTVFKISDFTASPRSFNPLNPGNLGNVRFSFKATAPGSAVIKVLDSLGNIVFTQSIINFNSENHSVMWSGLRPDGSVYPEGQYTATIEATAQDGWINESNNLSPEYANTSLTDSTLIVLDTSIFYPITSANASGTAMGVSLPRLMPEGVMLFSFTGASDFSLDTGYNATPFSMSLVFTPSSVFETSFRLGFEAQGTSIIPVFGGLSLKASFPIWPFYVGGLVRYSYSNMETLVPTFSESGLGIGFIGGYEYGKVLFSVSEEIVFGVERGIFDKLDAHVKTGLSANYQSGAFASTVWALLYSPFTTNSVSFFGTFETGLDVTYLLPNSSFSPIVGFSYRHDEFSNSNMAIRFGVNILLL